MSTSQEPDPAHSTRKRAVYHRKRSIYLETPPTPSLGATLAGKTQPQPEQEQEDNELDDDEPDEGMDGKENDKGDNSEEDVEKTDYDPVERTRRGWEARRLNQRNELDLLADPVLESEDTPNLPSDELLHALHHYTSNFYTQHSLLPTPKTYARYEPWETYKRRLLLDNAEGRNGDGKRRKVGRWGGRDEARSEEEDGHVRGESTGRLSRREQGGQPRGGGAEGNAQGAGKGPVKGKGEEQRREKGKGKAGLDESSTSGDGEEDQEEAEEVEEVEMVDDGEDAEAPGANGQDKDNDHQEEEEDEALVEIHEAISQGRHKRKANTEKGKYKEVGKYKRRDMREAFDGTALIALVFLVEEHIARELRAIGYIRREGLGRNEANNGVNTVPLGGNNGDDDFDHDDEVDDNENENHEDMI